jgi:hypothetical protein
MTFVGDNDDPTSVLNDARAFFTDWFTTPVDDQANEQVSNEWDANALKQSFAGRKPGYWGIGERLAALVQVYDLVAPLNPDLAAKYLRRLKYLVQALVDCRDDRWPADQLKTDGSRHRVMPAWGQIENNRDGRWNTDVDTSGLFVYPMAAFARRVARAPAHHAEFGADAIQMITAVFETFRAFLDELRFRPSEPYAFFTVPEGYGDLQCDSHSGDDDDQCSNFRSLVGKPIPYNQNLSMLQALAELALAADSALYRASTDASPLVLFLTTQEAPLVVAKGVAFFADHLRLETLDDGSPYFQWNYALTGSDIEDVSHGQFELGCLAAILEAESGINDAPEQARELVRLLRDVPCKINLIPFNPFPDSGFVTSSRNRIVAFQRILQDAGLVATVRKTRGDDIDAACGQLAGQVQDKTRRTIKIQPVTPSQSPGP